MDTNRAKLDPREETFLVDSDHNGLRLFLRRLAPRNVSRRPPVLYLHGATFPSALSIAYRFKGQSWRDALAAEGFDVWALDFLGFGGSDRYREMQGSAVDEAPLGLAARALEQVEVAVRFILDAVRCSRLSLITHSWGSMPADCSLPGIRRWSTA